MSRGLQIDYETADRITICVLKDQLRYLEKEQEWYEADEEGRKNLVEKWNHPMYVHAEDYAKNTHEYIPALTCLIEYFGG